MVNDTLSDVLIRLKNAQAVGRTSVVIPRSNLTEALLNLLVQEGYLAAVNPKQGESVHPELEVVFPAGRPQPFKTLQRVSKPGQRIYLGYRQLTRPLQGYGLAILSTSRGLLTDRQAKRERLGGELLCIVA